MNKKRLMSLTVAASSILGLGKSVSAADNYEDDIYDEENYDSEDDYFSDDRTLLNSAMKIKKTGDMI